MFMDSLVTFVAPGAPLSLVSSVPVESQVYDILGNGVGAAPTSIIGDTASTFGTDMGVGGVRPELVVIIGTAAATSNNATLTVQLQAAPDTGAAGGYQPGTWQTIEQSPAMTAAQLTAGTFIMRLPFPPAFPANLQPRFMRLQLSPAAGTSFTAGSISTASVTMVRDDLSNKFAQKNFVV